MSFSLWLKIIIDILRSIILKWSNQYRLKYHQKIAESTLLKSFNLTKVIWLPEGLLEDEDPFSGYLPYQNSNILRAGSANGHIDEFCRFIGPDTILLAEVTDEEAKQDPLHALNKQRLDKCYQVLLKATDHEGKPFKIIRIPVPEHEAIAVKPGDQPFEIYAQGAIACDHLFDDGSPFPDVTKSFKVLAPLSYCNFIISNTVVIGQSYYAPGKPEAIKIKDQKVKSILQSSFPDKQVIMINALPLNLGGGGIHCCTRNVPMYK